MKPLISWSLIMNSSLIIISLCFLLPFTSLGQLLHPPSSSPVHDRGLSFEEEKTRLGSTPPSCHNKCNGCHPCMAVQVPTFPGRHGHRIQPAAALSKAISASTSTDDDDGSNNSMQFFDPSSDQYSNYKPLGWKCRCRDHFYNP